MFHQKYAEDTSWHARYSWGEEARYKGPVLSMGERVSPQDKPDAFWGSDLGT